MSAVYSSLQIFNAANMTRLRQKSLRMTKFLETLLTSEDLVGPSPPYTIITPRQPDARGAQLSVRLNPGLLETVLGVLEDGGVIIDERKPDVIRVAPAPLYNNFQDVYSFCEIFRKALGVAQSGKTNVPSDAVEQVAEVFP